MATSLPCDIVRDLLPSYVDGLTGDCTNQAVEAHLEQCEACAQARQQMAEPQPIVPAAVPEVDYLKKVRRKTSRVGLVCGIVMMVLGMLLIFSRVFLIGTKASAQDAHLIVQVDGSTVYVGGNLEGSTAGFSRMVFEQSGGIVNVVLYTAPRAFFSRSSFSETFVAEGEVGLVRCGSLILWEDGTEIDPMAAQLFAAKNQYVGDMSGNSSLASILGISEQFGSFTNELQTETEPYGWIIRLETALTAAEEPAARQQMAEDAQVLLATIENLGYVNWAYETEEGAQTFTLSTEQATALAGTEIKHCADTVTDLQKLLHSLKWQSAQEGILTVEKQPGKD